MEYSADGTWDGTWDGIVGYHVVQNVKNKYIEYVVRRFLSKEDSSMEKRLRTRMTCICEVI
jgi:hypothetical protein